jgi:hypothetical protein
MKFKSDSISNLLRNDADVIGKTIRSITGGSSVVRQGYGVSPKIPIRFLAYAVPVFRLAREMKSATKVELYFATGGVARANGKNYSGNSQLMANLLRIYAKKLYPDLNYVALLDDRLELDRGIRSTIDYYFENAIKVIDNDISLLNFVNNRGGKNAVQYMIEHLLYMQDPILINNTHLSYLDALVPEMGYYDHVLMIGGQSEKIFWKFRQEMMKICGTHEKWKLHQFFSPIGDPPTYHTYESEPVIGDSLPGTAYELMEDLRKMPNGFGKISNIVRDYTVLLQDLAGVEKFKTPGNVSQDVLETGYEKLKQFIFWLT